GLGQNQDQKVDGVSITPLLSGEEIAERPLFWHYPHYGNQGGAPSGIVRCGEWKLIRYYEDNHLELYNLDIDISELEPLNHLYPEKVQELDSMLQEWLAQTEAIMPTPDREYSPQKEAALKESWRTTALKAKERERRAMLKSDWKPNDSWWDSKVTMD
ncbi:MAG: sulfatase/phosphatase domain-containing protein, partial [Rikenellaceae bacterium]